MHAQLQSGSHTSPYPEAIRCVRFPLHLQMSLSCSRSGASVALRSVHFSIFRSSGVFVCLFCSSGHQVYQVPDIEKAEVPEEVQRAAREMAERAFQDRLREIKMSAFDQEQYEEFAEPIRLCQSIFLLTRRLMIKGRFGRTYRRKHLKTNDMEFVKLSIL